MTEGVVSQYQVKRPHQETGRQEIGKEVTKWIVEVLGRGKFQAEGTTSTKLWDGSMRGTFTEEQEDWCPSTSEMRMGRKGSLNRALEATRWILTLSNVGCHWLVWSRWAGVTRCDLLFQSIILVSNWKCRGQRWKQWDCVGDNLSTRWEMELPWAVVAAGPVMRNGQIYLNRHVYCISPWVDGKVGFINLGSRFMAPGSWCQL